MDVRSRSVLGAAFAYRTDDRLVDGCITDCLHHRQMLEIIMRLEQCITSEELHQNATNAPDITWEAPAKVENDLRSSVMSSRNNGRVVLIIERGRTKVDQSYLRVK